MKTFSTSNSASIGNKSFQEGFSNSNFIYNISKKDGILEFPNAFALAYVANHLSTLNPYEFNAWQERVSFQSFRGIYEEICTNEINLSSKSTDYFNNKLILEKPLMRSSLYKFYPEIILHKRFENGDFYVDKNVYNQSLANVINVNGLVFCSGYLIKVDSSGLYNLTTGYKYNLLDHYLISSLLPRENNVNNMPINKSKQFINSNFSKNCGCNHTSNGNFNPSFQNNYQNRNSILETQNSNNLKNIKNNPIGNFSNIPENTINSIYNLNLADLTVTLATLFPPSLSHLHGLNNNFNIGFNNQYNWINEGNGMITIDKSNIPLVYTRIDGGGVPTAQQDWDGVDYTPSFERHETERNTALGKYHLTGSLYFWQEIDLASNAAVKLEIKARSQHNTGSLLNPNWVDENADFRIKTNILTNNVDGYIVLPNTGGVTQNLHVDYSDINTYTGWGKDMVRRLPAWLCCDLKVNSANAVKIFNFWVQIKAEWGNKAAQVLIKS
jgi:hypothetical protein